MKHIDILTFSAAICLSATALHAGAADAIATQSVAWETAYSGGDSAGLAALYTDNALLMPPDGPMSEGRDAVQAFWQGFMDAGVANVDLTTVSVDDLGDTANEVGTFTADVPDGNGGTVVFAGKYLVVWKKQGDGTWLLYQDIWNAGH